MGTLKTKSYAQERTNLKTGRYAQHERTRKRKRKKKGCFKNVLENQQTANEHGIRRRKRKGDGKKLGQ